MSESLPLAKGVELNDLGVDALLALGFRADTRGPSCLGLHVIQAPQAFYVFLYRYTQTPPAAIENAIERVVMSFRLA